MFKTDYNTNANLFTLVISLKDKEIYDAAIKVINYYRLYQILFDLDIVEEEGKDDQNKNNNFMGFRAQLDIETGRNVFKLYEGVVNASGSPDKDKRIASFF